VPERLLCSPSGTSGIEQRDKTRADGGRQSITKTARLLASRTRCPAEIATTTTAEPWVSEGPDDNGSVRQPCSLATTRELVGRGAVVHPQWPEHQPGATPPCLGHHIFRRVVRGSHPSLRRFPGPPANLHPQGQRLHTSRGRLEWVFATYRFTMQEATHLLADPNRMFDGAWSGGSKGCPTHLPVLLKIPEADLRENPRAESRSHDS
jgi:hypothetical protein